MASTGTCPSPSADDPPTVTPNMIYVENDDIKLGVDLSIGGAITYLSTSDGLNMINSHDWGRQIQMSCYGGPQPYIPEGVTIRKAWEHLGWNPIQSGDTFGYPSEVLEYEADEDEKQIYVKCRPMHWPLKNHPAECVFECRYRLDGNAVVAECKFTNERTDHDGTVQYHARNQELPAVYSNGTWYRIVTYTGSSPFTNDGELTEIPREPENPPFPWNRFFATEEWAALVNDDDVGFGVWSPGAQRYVGGYVKNHPNEVGSGPKNFASGYVAPVQNDIIDHNIVYDYSYHLVVGDVQTVRDYVYERRRRGAPPNQCDAAEEQQDDEGDEEEEEETATTAETRSIDYAFRNDRQHFYYNNAVDTGYPIRNNELDIRLYSQDEAKNSLIISPWFCVDAESIRSVRIRAAFSMTAATDDDGGDDDEEDGPRQQQHAHMVWTKYGSDQFGGGQAARFNVTADGEMRTYKVNLEHHRDKKWNGTIVRLGLLFRGGGAGGDGGGKIDRVRIKWIRSV